MKHILLSCLALLLIFSTLSSTQAFTTEQQNTIDRVITRWHARQPESALASRTQKILDRINDLQTRARLTAEAGALLSYVELRMTNILLALDNKPLLPMTPWTTTPSLPASSLTFPATMKIPASFESTNLLIAGSVSPLLREIKYAISTEPMIIDQVVLQASRDDISDRVREFALYDEQGYLVDTAYAVDRTINFDNLNFRRETGSQRFYLALSTYTTDTLSNSTPATFTLSVQDIFAEGVYSQDDIRPTIGSNSSPTFTIAPVGISSVQFVSRWNGYNTDSYLSNSENTVGILEISTPAVTSKYDQQIVLEDLDVYVADNTVWRQAAANLRLQRIDLSGTQPTIAGSVQWNNVVFALDSLGDGAIIAQGESAVFRLTTNISLDNSSRESVQISISDLKNGDLTYRQQWSNELITTIQQTEWEIFSPRLSD